MSTLLNRKCASTHQTCRLHVSSRNPAEEGRDSDILRLQEVVPRIAQTSELSNIELTTLC